MRFYWDTAAKVWIVEAHYPLPGGRAAGHRRTRIDSEQPMDAVTIRKMLDTLRKELETWQPWL